MLILFVYLNISLQGPCIRDPEKYIRCGNIQVLVFNSIKKKKLSHKSSDGDENIISEMQNDNKYTGKSAFVYPFNRQYPSSGI